MGFKYRNQEPRSGWRNPSPYLDCVQVGHVEVADHEVGWEVDHVACSHDGVVHVPSTVEHVGDTQ